MTTYNINPVYDLEMVTSPDNLEMKNEVELEKTATKQGWGTIRSKVHKRIKKRKEKSDMKQNMTKSGIMINYLLNNLQNQDGSINRKTARFMSALKRREDGYENFGDKLANELFITGKVLFEIMTPWQTGQGLFIWTTLYTVVNIIIFVYMSADYSWYLYLLAVSGTSNLCPSESPFREKYCTGSVEITCNSICSSRVTSHGIKNSTIADDFNIDMSPPLRAFQWVKHLVIPGQTSDQQYALYHFDAEYLVAWGGKYLPNINKCNQWYRWITSIFIHHSAGHLFSNFLLFIFLAGLLEKKYGTWRLMFVSSISGIGGNFLSSYLDSNRCLVVVGASGACYGIMGLFVADMALNYESIKRPILRTLIVSIFVIFNLIMVHTDDGVSHTSHLGGFLVGLFPSFLFLPNFKSESWEALLPPLGILTLLIFMIILPVTIYSNMKKDLSGFLGESCTLQYNSVSCLI